MLGQRPDLQIVGEVSNGLEAVKIAEELQPDLIVLDGIEAARRIRKLSPNSKVLFVSQESSADIVQEALTAGGLGYVFKAYAQCELLVAVEAALQSKQFVSSALTNGLRPTQQLQ
jgi:DNA-binding NarL/FixJ family response regulator